MFTFLILLVIHIIFQTLEWWAGISSKGGPTNQTQCDFGFISLLKHLVLFSARQERGWKHVKALTALIPGFSFCHCIMKLAACLHREMKVIPQRIDLPRLIVMPMRMKTLCRQLFQLPAWVSCLEQRRLRCRSLGSMMTWFTYNRVTLNVMALIRVMWTTATSQIC